MQEKRSRRLQPGFRLVLSAAWFFSISSNAAGTSSQSEGGAERVASGCSSVVEDQGLIEWRDRYGVHHANDSLIHEEMLQSAYVTSRDGAQMLVRESRSAGKSMTLVPLHCDDGRLSFNKILIISIDYATSHNFGSQIFSGLEIETMEGRELSNVSWETIDDIVSSGLKETTLKLKPIELPDGSYTIPIALVNLRTNVAMERHYVGRPRAFIEGTIACYNGCGPRAPAQSKNYEGFVGKHPVTAVLSNEGDRLAGTYRYKTSNSNLYVSGKVAGEVVSLIECADKLCARVTGHFTGKLVNGLFEGAWTSGSHDGVVHKVALFPSKFAW